MDTQKCFKCDQVLPLLEFYSHSKMANGRLGKCKDCNKKDVRENRLKRIEYYREYDRDRGNRQTPKYQREYRKKYPQRQRAKRMVAYHIMKGNLTRKPCEICKTTKNTHAHHDDYGKPLDVRWLCAVHHSQWHKENSAKE